MRTRKNSAKLLQKSYLVGPETRFELEQLHMSSQSVGDMAGRALRALNQLAVIAANTELEAALRQVPAVASELDLAKQRALADEMKGGDSYRFPA